MKRKKWTDKEFEILENEYPTMGGVYVSNKINRSVTAINKMASELNIETNYRIEFATKNEILDAINKSNNVVQVLRNLNKITCGTNINLLKKHCKKHNIEMVFEKNKHNRIKRDILELLVSGSTISSNKLKMRLYHDKIKQPICEICGQNEIWNGNKMSLILDHINGISDDNRLENLRIVCPNCNATLPTHCRGYKKLNEMKKRENEQNIIKEKNHKKFNSVHFSDAQIENSLSQRKVKRPPYNQLIEEINMLGYVGTGKKYGVSDNAIRKWKKIYEKYDTLNVISDLKKNRIKYDDNEVEQIKDYYNSSNSYIKTMKEFNISSKGTLYYILKNR